MVEVEFAEGEAEHTDWRVDDAFPRKGRDQQETLASRTDNVEQPFPREPFVGVRRTDTLDLNSRSFGCGQFAEVTLQQDRQCAPFGIHGVPSDHLLGTLYRRFLCEAMPNRKYGAFNTKMTNTIKEGRTAEPLVEQADVPNEQLHPSVLVKMELGCETQTLRKSQQILAVLRILEASSSAGLALQMLRRELNLAAIIVSAFTCSAAFAQPEVIRCLPPEMPVTDLPEAVLAEYRTEITAEFEAYFAAVSIHIACLDTERNRALTEAHRATEAYSTFLNIPPAQKDLP
jgi:hypothetical protein